MRFKQLSMPLRGFALVGAAVMVTGASLTILGALPIERYLVTTLVVSALDQHEFVVSPAHAHYFALGQAVTMRVDARYYHGRVAQHAKTNAAGQLMVKLEGLTASWPVGSAITTRLILGRASILATWLTL